MRSVLLAATALLALGVAPVAAGPEGGSVVGGAATIQGQGGPAVIVNQSTPSAIINWNTFNIRANESVRFNQPSASSVALNRVTGGLGPSEIMGTLTANGRVFIINRDGILFGPGSVVNTAGFLATTNDIKNADFMAGRYNFNIPGRPDASIVNQGNDHGVERRLCRAGRARRAQFRHHHRDARHGRAGIRQQLHARHVRRQADHARGRRQHRQQGHRRRHRPAAQVAGQQHQERHAQRQRRAGRAHRRGGARGGRFRHQHQGRDQGQLDRPPQRHDRAQRRHRRQQAGGRSGADHQARRHDLGGGQAPRHDRRHDRGERRAHQARQCESRCLRPPRRRQGADRRRLGRRPSGPEPRQQRRAPSSKTTPSRPRPR